MGSNTRIVYEEKPSFTMHETAKMNIKDALILSAMLRQRPLKKAA